MNLDPNSNFESMSKSHPFFGFDLLLATMHNKERVIQGPLRRSLGIQVNVPTDINTDVLGTFSGEIERKGTPKEVAIEKAKMALSMSNCRLSMATEGSFGPHPIIPLLPSHHELMLLYDREADVAISEQMIFETTNFGSLVITGKNDDQLDTFLKKAKFGSHGVIVRPHSPKNSSPPTIKGISDYPTLLSAISRCQEDSIDSKIRIETDMRANFNPSRMLGIRKLTRKLVERLWSFCPQCSYPGWGPNRSEKGLPCDECEMPSSWVRNLVHECGRCRYVEISPRQDGLTHAPSEHCQWCNP